MNVNKEVVKRVMPINRLDQDDGIHLSAFFSFFYRLLRLRASVELRREAKGKKQTQRESLLRNRTVRLIVFNKRSQNFLLQLK